MGVVSQPIGTTIALYVWRDSIEHVGDTKFRVGESKPIGVTQFGTEPIDREVAYALRREGAGSSGAD